MTRVWGLKKICIYVALHREFVRYLKRNSGWLSAIICLWNIPSTRGADKSLARPWKETTYSSQDVRQYTKTYGVQTTGIYCCKCPAIISQPTGTRSALEQLFHGWNILTKLLTMLISHCPEILWEEVFSESLRNACVKTYHSPYLCRIVQVQHQAPYHDSFMPYDYPKHW